MKHALIAIAVSGALAGMAGCANDRSSTEAAPTSAAPTSGSPSPPAASLIADTERICDELDTSMDAGFKEFGSGLGQMIAYKQASNAAAATAAKQAAQQKANDLATVVRTRTGAAQDPEFQGAGAKAADNIAASARDEAFFASMKTIKDLDKLEGEISGWVVPIAAYCG